MFMITLTVITVTGQVDPVDQKASEVTIIVKNINPVDYNQLV